MIPDSDIAAWQESHPWASKQQVEQDLLLSRAIIEISQVPVLADDLVMIGGTALHKVHAKAPLRYSEDLDFMRSQASPIGPTMRALTELGRDLGFNVKTRMGQIPKVMWRTTSAEGQPIRLKIEMSKTNAPLQHEPVALNHTVTTSWWTGRADVRTADLRDIGAGKALALFQRRKGRDVFDLWVLTEHLGVPAHEIAVALAAQRPNGMTAKSTAVNLTDKLHHPEFGSDLDSLITKVPEGFDLDGAAAAIQKTIYDRLSLRTR